MGFCSAVAQAYSGTCDQQRLLFVCCQAATSFGRSIAAHGFAKKLGTPNPLVQTQNKSHYLMAKKGGKLAISGGWLKLLDWSLRLGHPVPWVRRKIDSHLEQHDQTVNMWEDPSSYRQPIPFTTFDIARKGFDIPRVSTCGFIWLASWGFRFAQLSGKETSHCSPTET